MTLTRGFIRDAAMTPLDARLMNMAGLVCNNDGSPRTGVLGNAGTTPTAGIVSTLATMNVAIAAAEFATSKGKADGVPIFTNNGVVNVAIGAAPASNSRIDVIYVKHNDNTTGDANALPIFGVLAGTAAASPTKPGPIPTGALELATLRVYAGTTATNGGSNLLTNTYQMTAARGAAVPFRTIAERDAWTNPVDGQLAFVLAADATYQYLATAPTPGWYHTAGAPEIVGITPGGLWQAATGAVDQGGVPQMRKHSGMVIGAGAITNNATVAVAAGSSYVIATIADATMRPDVDRFFATGTISNATAGILKVGADGNISWRANAAASWGAGTLRIDFGGVIFTQKGLV